MCAEQRVTLFSLGAGDFGYKSQFGNAHVEVGDVWLLRRTLRNRLVAAAHGRFRDVVVLTRDWARPASPTNAKSATAKPAP